MPQDHLRKTLSVMLLFSVESCGVFTRNLNNFLFTYLLIYQFTDFFCLYLYIFLFALKWYESFWWKILCIVIAKGLYVSNEYFDWVWFRNTAGAGHGSMIKQNRNQLKDEIALDFGVFQIRFFKQIDSYRNVFMWNWKWRREFTVLSRLI